MLSMPFTPAMCRCGGKPAQAFDERSAWKSCAEVSRHRDLLSSQRGFSTCRVTQAPGKIWESGKSGNDVKLSAKPSVSAARTFSAQHRHRRNQAGRKHAEQYRNHGICFGEEVHRSVLSGTEPRARKVVSRLPGNRPQNPRSIFT